MKKWLGEKGLIDPITLTCIVIGATLLCVLIGAQIAEPMGCSPAPEIVMSPPPPQTPPAVVVKPAPKALPPCIFPEGIKGCVYNDKAGRKEGPNAYKRYDSAEVER